MTALRRSYRAVTLSCSLWNGTTMEYFGMSSNDYTTTFAAQYSCFGNHLFLASSRRLCRRLDSGEKLARGLLVWTLDSCRLSQCGPGIGHPVTLGVGVSQAIKRYRVRLGIALQFRRCHLQLRNCSRKFFLLHQYIAQS